MGRILFIIGILFLATPVRAEPQEWVYTVRPGDTLWDLSETYLSSMQFHDDLQKLNQIQNPKHLIPGTRIRFPLKWLKIQPVPVRVLAVSGTVTVKSAQGGPPAPAEVHQLLHIQDELITGPDSSVLIHFADGSQLLLQSESVLKLDVVNIYGETGMVDTRLRLKNGRVDSEVNPMEIGPGDRFEIHTPGAISSVRGTKLRVMSNIEQEVARTEVLSGVLDVIASGQTIEVPGGFGTVMKFNQPPRPPKRLLPSPDLSGLPKNLIILPTAFQWPELNGALQYRVQLAKKEKHQHFSEDFLVNAPDFFVPDLKNGEYIVRIRGIDDLGLEGMNASHHFKVEVKPVPDAPGPVSPEPDHPVLNDRPVFRWEKSDQATAYHFQLSRTTTFDTLIVDEKPLPETEYLLDVPLDPGEYYWRVAASNPSGIYSAFSPPSTLRILEKPFYIDLSPVVFQEDHYWIKWQANTPEKHYDVHIAKDPEFADVVLKQQTRSSEMHIVIPYAGDYFVRVRTVEKEGLAGTISPVRSFKIPCENCWLSFSLGLLGLLILL